MDRKTVYLSSKNRSTGTSDNFTIIDTQERFVNTPQSVKSKTITIPVTWYNVTEANNKFEFTGDETGLHEIVIPPGNYSGATLAKALQDAITAILGCGEYTVVYDCSTGKFTISSKTEAFSIDFTIDENMADLLGFEEVVTDSLMSHTSTKVANIIIDTEVWVCTNLISGIDNGVLPWTENPPKTEKQGVIACVPITACFGGIIHYTVPIEFPQYTITNSKFTNPGDDPRELQLSLAFPSGAPLSLNGHDWSMQIIFDFNRP
jgi:hypothetical protein